MLTDVDPSKFRGWFGTYDHNFFAIYLDHQDEIFLVLNDLLIPRNEIAHIQWTKSYASRRLEIHAGGVSHEFVYQKLWWNFLLRPTYALWNIILVDNWWGVVADLPGWTEANWRTEPYSDFFRKALARQPSKVGWA